MPVLQPNVTLNIVKQSALVSVGDRRALIIGQMLSGSATAGDLEQDVADGDVAINALFGQRSAVAEMVRNFKAINPTTDLDVIPLDDNGSAVDATATIVVAGTATAAGRIYVEVASAKRYRVPVDISVGDAAATVAAAINTATGANADAPFTSGVSTVTVTYTASNGGTHANTWPIRVQGAIPGLTFTVNGWASGAADPSLTSLFDVVGSVRYTTIVWPEVYDITVLETFIEARFNVNNDVLDGVGIVTKVDTLSNIKTFASPLNSESIVVEGVRVITATGRPGNALREMPDVASSQIGATRSLRLTDGTNLTQFMTTSASRDQVGGVHISTLPYANTSLPNLPSTLPADEWTRDDTKELNDAGVSIVGPNRAFNEMIMGEQVTTYLNDTAGNPDTSFKFLNTVDTMSVIRETFVNNFRTTYAQTRLTDGDLVIGLDMTNEPAIRAFCKEVYGLLADDGIVAAGSAAVTDFNQNLIITLDLSTGTATISMAPLLVSQLRVIIGTIQVNFGD